MKKENEKNKKCRNCTEEEEGRTDIEKLRKERNL
jgi:hypothetical protein